jgi:hypothetical protein
MMSSHFILLLYVYSVVTVLQLIWLMPHHQLDQPSVGGVSLPSVGGACSMMLTG